MYITGYKIGQVESIKYDFTADSSFLVTISINRDIALPKGTEMVLVQDGLLGGGAIELRVPAGTHTDLYASGEMLPTSIEPGLMDIVQHEMLAKITSTVEGADSLIANVNSQLRDDHLYKALANVDEVSRDLTVVSKDAKNIVKTDIPRLVQSARTTVDGLNAPINDIKHFTRQLDRVDLPATIARVDTALEHVDGAVVQLEGVVTDIRSTDGTLGSLIYSRTLYDNLDSTVVAADSLLRDLKANPKRYVHFSIFGSKEKKK